MNKKVLLLVLALVVAIGMMAVGCGEEATTDDGTDETTGPEVTLAPGETLSLTFSDHNPPGNAVAETLIAYGAYLEEESDGALEIDVQVGGALYQNQEIFDGLVTGGVDAGSYVPDDGDGLYYNTVCNLPFINYEDDRDAAEVFWTLWDEFPELEQEYTDLGLVLTTTYLMPPVHMHWHADNVVVTTPADLDGKTLITLESYLADWLQVLGASVEQPAFPDLFPMLETQAADGFAMHYNFLGGFDLVPAFKSHTVFGGGGVNRGQIGVVWNKDSFDSLPTALQQAALDGQDFYLDTVIPGSAADYDKAMAAQDDTHTVTELTAEEITVWRDALASVYQDWVDGAPDPALAQQMVDRLLELTE